ncbi:MAG: zinc ribbon domain-containing protein [Methanomassiliicoccales archaeon]|jgi:hypothetical protein|nr:zinc ribbon domain-containing protein [Methanomassiliicoccales archaeon]
MEKKAGFKECPRCGLRNKISATECDFCGWNFGEIRDEWTDHLLELERIVLQKEERSVEREDSRIVEATLVKTRDLAIEEEEEPLPQHSLQPPTSEISETPSAPLATPSSREIEQSLEQEQSSTPSFSAEIAEPPVPPTAEEEVPEQLTRDQEAASVDVGVEESTIATIEDAHLKGRLEGEVTLERVRPLWKKLILRPGEVRGKGTTGTESYAIGRKSLSLEIRATLMAAGFVIVGFSVYLTILLVSSVFTFSQVLGWTVSVAGAVMIVIGFVRIINVKHLSQETSGYAENSNNKNDERGELEVLICPVCHEVVSSEDQFCPACGAMFETLRQEEAEVL